MLFMYVPCHLMTNLWCGFSHCFYGWRNWGSERISSGQAQAHRASQWWGWDSFPSSVSKPSFLCGHAPAGHSALPAFVLLQILVPWTQWQGSARITPWNGTTTRRSSPANSSGTAAAGAMLTGSKPRESVRCGVSQHSPRAESRSGCICSHSPWKQVYLPWNGATQHSN